VRKMMAPNAKSVAEVHRETWSVPTRSAPLPGGYWGDYDDMQVFRDQQGRTMFIRSYSDSSQGCYKRWWYTSEHLHVSTVRFQ
jgi:hypothetical protein